MRLWLYANVVLRVSGDVDLYRYGLVWLLVCLLVRWHVGLLSAYRPPRSTRTLAPSLGGERGGECFILSFLLPVLQNVFDFTWQLHNHSRLF